MSIRPIDMLVMPNRSQETSQMQNAAHAKAEHAQNAIQAHHMQEVRHDSEQTVRMNKSENNEHRYDAKEKGNSSYQNSQGQRKKKESETEDKPHEIKISNFDMRI